MENGRSRKHVKDLLDRETEKPVLENLYIHYGVATDQLRREQQTLHAIVSAFNRIISRDFSANDILRYMMNRRKQTDWPKLGKKAKKFESVTNLLSSLQLDKLKQIYLELDITSDELLFRPKVMQEISHRFEGLTGIKFSGNKLVAIIMAKRKRGLWIRIREAFGDVAQISEQLHA